MKLPIIIVVCVCGLFEIFLFFGLLENHQRIFFEKLKKLKKEKIAKNIQQYMKIQSI
jgi:hypothetical protein